MLGPGMTELAIELALVCRFRRGDVVGADHDVLVSESVPTVVGRAATTSRPGSTGDGEGM